MSSNAQGGSDTLGHDMCVVLLADTCGKILCGCWFEKSSINLCVSSVWLNMCPTS